MFDAPSQGGGSVKPADVQGHLLIVEPIEYVQNISTSFGEKDAIRVNVHDVTDATSHDDVLLFGTALIGSSKHNSENAFLASWGKAPPSWTGSAVDLRRCHRQRQSCQGRHRVPQQNDREHDDPHQGRHQRPGRRT